MSCDVKENVINQTRPPSFIAPCLNSDAHMALKGAISGVHESSRVFCTSLSKQPHMEQVVMHCVFDNFLL